MTRHRTLAAAVVAATLVAAGVLVVPRLGSGGTTVDGIFADANPIIAGDTVRASGVEVGKVTSVTLDHGKARVAMRLDRSVLPLHRDATLNIRPVNVLGEQYVELNTGTPSAPLMPQPATIPESQTRKSVGLQDILNSLDDPTSAALAALVTGLGEGVDGQGTDVAAAIKALKPALSQVDRLGKILDDQNAVLTRLVDHAQPVASALAADDGRSVDHLVDSTDRVLATVAANRKSLDQSLALLPATLTKAQRTLAQVAKVSDEATPALASVRPITDDLTEISGEIQRLTEAADPALVSLRPVLDHAKALLDQAAPLVHELGPAGQNLHGVASAARPTAETLIRNLGDVMDFVRWWALSTNGYDGLSHYFRGLAVETPKALLTTVQGVAGVPKVQSPEQAPAQAPERKSALPGLTGLARSPLASGSPNATGLTPQQERSLLGQLLGGGW